MSIRTQDRTTERSAHRTATKVRSLVPASSARPSGNGPGNGLRRNGGMGLNEERLARGLAWFSIGLGLAEVAAPRRVSRLAGVNDDHSLLVRLLGLREIAHGIGILSQRRPTEGVWSRVGGDAIDLAGLGMAFMSPSSDKVRLTAATAAVLGVTALDVICAQQLTRDPNETTESGNIRVRKSVTIDRSPEELYGFWRSFENLPRFMDHLESVEVTGERHSHWVAKAPAGSTVEWDAEIVEDRPNELIAWRSIEGADVDNAGTVRFRRATGGRGTVVDVDIEYYPPGGIVGAGVARLFGEEPTQQVTEDLRRFKRLIETGEVIVSDATLHGVGVTQQRPGQPPTDDEIEQ